MHIVHGVIKVHLELFQGVIQMSVRTDVQDFPGVGRVALEMWTAGGLNPDSSSKSRFVTKGSTCNCRISFYSLICCRDSNGAVMVRLTGN